MRKIAILILACAAMLISSRAAAQGVITRTGIENPDKWINTYFAQGKVPPFSFAYEEISSGKFITEWKFSKKKLSAPKGEVAYTVSWTDPTNVIRVTCDVRGYADSKAVEWTLRFKNISRYNTSKVAVVRVADYKVSEPSASGFTARWTSGCNGTPDDFTTEEKDLRAGVQMDFTPEKGLSSTGAALPYFNVVSREADAGVVMAIGWTGRWNARLTGVTSLEYRMFAGLEKANFYLKPGEEVRTPLVATIFWKGSYAAEGQNALRRFILAHHSPAAPVRKVGGFDQGNPAPCHGNDCLDGDMALATVKRYKQLSLVPEAFMMEKGWYTAAGDWAPREEMFPDGLSQISSLIHKYGSKMVVRLDVEEIAKGTPAAKEFADYMMLGGKKMGYVFDFSQPKAVDALCKYVGDMMAREGIDGLVCDFGGDLAHYWDLADGVDRAGLVEMKYIAGLYRFCDYIAGRFPGCIIDITAAGKRLDLEAVSRSSAISFGRELTPELAQCQMYALNQYMPLAGMVAMDSNPYDTRSRLGGTFNYCFNLFQRGSDGEQMQRRLQDYSRFGDYFLCDYYPLSGLVAQRHQDRWIAGQWHNPKSDSGIIVAFRRSLSENVTFAAVLKGIDPDAAYELEDCDSGKRSTVSGRELAKGYRIRIEDPCSSVLIKYQRK